MIPQEKKSCVVQTTFLAYSLIGGAESLTIMIAKAFNSHLLTKVSSSFSF